MRDTPDRILIRIDASVFERKIGDLVRSGEKLGRFDGQPVTTPLDAVIENISFDARDHTLHILLLAHQKIAPGPAQPCSHCQTEAQAGPPHTTAAGANAAAGDQSPPNQV